MFYLGAKKSSVKKSIKKACKSLYKTKTDKTTAKKHGKAAKQAAINNLAKRTSKKDKTKAPKKEAKKQMPPKSFAEIGAEGEQQIYDVLIRIFGPNNVFRNVYVMRTTGLLTEIDLLAIHPTGVYVVESKNYSGLVIGDGRVDEWIHIKGNNFRRTFYSPIAQNSGHIDALREACQYHVGFVPPMLSLLVFPDKCDLQITNLPPGLRCCQFKQIPSILKDVFQAVSPVLEPVHIQALAPLFYQSQQSVLPPTVQAQHIRDVARVRQWVNK